MKKRRNTSNYRENSGKYEIFIYIIISVILMCLIASFLFFYKFKIDKVNNNNNMYSEAISLIENSGDVEMEEALNYARPEKLETEDESNISGDDTEYSIYESASDMTDTEMLSGETTNGEVDTDNAESSANTESGGDSCFFYPNNNSNITASGDNSYIINNDSDEITITFAGDILFAEGYAIMANIRNSGGTIEGVIDTELLNEMRNSDLFMVNNEFPYSTRGTATENKTWTFRADPLSAQLLLDMGVDIVSIGNNHIFDYGEDALEDTLNTLNNIKMPYVGAGEDLEDASKIVYYETSSKIKLAFISGCDIEGSEPPLTRAATDSLSGVFRTRDDSLLCERVREAKENGAFVICYMHWGIESTTNLNYIQTQQAKDLATAGCDLIIGDHPHVLQSFDYVDGVPVIYSLGNFLFNSKTIDTGLLQVVVDKDGVDTIKFIPAIQKKSSVSIATGSEKERIISYLQGLSENVYIDSEGFITRKND